MSLNNFINKLNIETNALQVKMEGSAAKVEQLQDNLEILEEDFECENKKIDDKKNQIKCPVCLDVPRKGSVFAFPNVQLVCKKYKRESCPTCREVTHGR